MKFIRRIFEPRTLALILLFALLIAMSKVQELKNEVAEMEEKLMDEHECYDLFYDREDIIVLEHDDVEEYCGEMMGRIG
ncbi:hypothetical protein HQ533_03070 [Candidatus Woesearchaeota archaeon]|nr:hypothetical protein [Candidatus Woesearchaeota archaeon]